MVTKLREKVKMVLGKYLVVQKLYNTSFVKVIEEKIVSEYLNPKKAETICNIACGSGSYCIEMAKVCRCVYGMDISKQRIDIAKSITKGHNCYFKIGDAENLPYKSDTFDKVVSICSMEHFNNDEKALEEMNRVLKRDGILVLTVDSFTYQNIKGSLQDKHKNDHHVVNYYSAAQLIEKLDKHGFTVNEYKYFINSVISAFFFNLGIKLSFGPLFKLLFPIAYPLGTVSDKFWGRQDEGYCLAVKARKVKGD